MNYIDKNKLIVELRRQKRELKLSIQSQGDYGQSCQIIAYENILSLIASLQQEQPPKGYDEAYLNECIAKASKTWKGVDADKYLDEVRGREQEQPDIKSYIEELLKKCAGKDGEYYRSRRETLAHLFAYLGGNPSEYILQPVEQPEVNLEEEITRWLCEGDIADINFDDYDDADIEKTARHFYEFGKNSK